MNQDSVDAIGLVPHVPLHGNFGIGFPNSTSHKDYIPGTLGGHALPVMGWFLTGLGYLYLTLRHFYDCKLHRYKFTASVEFPYRHHGRGFFNIALLKYVPFTAVSKFSSGSAYFWLDVLLKGLPSMTIPVLIPHLQHDTIAATFIFSGLVDILSVCQRTRTVIPYGADYAFFSMTFIIEVLQFVTHLGGRTPVDVRLHQLQASVAACTVLILVAEANYRHCVELSVIRALLVTLQGTWMCHLMLILYHPLGLRPWDLHSDESVETVSYLFLWHIVLLLHLAFVADLWFARSYSASKRVSGSREIRPLMNRLSAH